MKKNTILFFLFFAGVMVSQAQTEKGSKLIGGNGYVQFNDPFYLGLAPNLGFFVADNIVLGGTLPFSFNKSSNYQGTALGLTGFARYYIPSTASTRVFGVGSIGVGHNWYKSDGDFGETKSSSGNNILSLGAGVVHFITNQVGLEAVLGYNSYQNGGGGKRQGIFALSLGFQIYLPKIKV